MALNIVAVSGWAFPKDIFHFSLADCSICKYDFSEWMQMSPQERITCCNQPNTVLVGWSLGAFLLHPFLVLPQVYGAIFISTAETFIKTSQNPYGVPSFILQAMKNKLPKHKDQLLQNFYHNVYHPLPPTILPNLKFFSINCLHLGLAELEKACHQPIANLNKPVVTFHGKEDKILNWRASQMWAKNFNYDFILLPNHGHALTPKVQKQVALRIAKIYNDQKL